MGKCIMGSKLCVFSKTEFKENVVIFVNFTGIRV